MVSDQDLAKGVETLLRQSDPTSLTSLSSVVHQLEAKLGLDLSDKTNFIRDQINLLLRSSHPPASSSASSSTPQPPPSLSPQQLHFGVNVPAKGHFVLHPPSQQQYLPQHFALQPSPYHSYDLNFQQPYPPYMPPPQQQHQHQRQGPSVLLPQATNASPSVSQSPKERFDF